jgi:hypothetical protein
MNDEELIEFARTRGIKGLIHLTPEEFIRVIMVVEKYTKEHIAGHLTENVCLFNAGSEREQLLEDDLVDRVNDEAVHLTASALWSFGFDANHGEE